MPTARRRSAQTSALLAMRRSLLYTKWEWRNEPSPGNCASAGPLSSCSSPHLPYRNVLQGLGYAQKERASLIPTSPTSVIAGKLARILARDSFLRSRSVATPVVNRYWERDFPSGEQNSRPSPGKGIRENHA